MTSSSPSQRRMEREPKTLGRWRGVVGNVGAQETWSRECTMQKSNSIPRVSRGT